LSKKPATVKASVESPEPKLPSLPPSLKEEIDREIGPLVPQGQRDQIILRMARVIKSEAFSGPIAHPRHLREYEDILPGSAERIVSMAESAQGHNQAMESKVVSATVWQGKAGMVLGFIALILVLCAALYAGMNGNNVLAGLFLTTAVLGGASTLIRGKHANGTNGK